MSWTGIPELKESYRKLGPRLFWGIVVGLLAWLAIGMWLSLSLDWPDAYGFHCHGRGCWIDDLWHSPSLLAAGHRSAMEIGLFIWEWSLPAVIPAALIWRFLKTRPKLTIFEPKDPTE